jgi:DNA replication and repair protein RecF
MISTIRLQNFRSYKDSSFEFEPGVNIIVGPNASGKTNLLEAVMVLARGSSFRARDAELVQFDKAWARLDGNFEKQVRTVKIELAGEKPAKNFEIDNKPFIRLNLERSVPLVLFEPNHLQMLSRGPDARRDYFDDMLERSLPGFKSQASSYRRTLAQRNALLKHGPTQAYKQLFAWNIRLSELGAKIAAARHNLIEQINQDIAKNYSRIAKKKSKVELVYDSHFPAAHYASRMLSKLEKGAELDFQRGFTASGPHREDVLFYLAGQPASETASRGESRSLLLALKIFELQLIEKARGQPAIFLLDDVFSELDGSRRKALVSNLKSRQTLITTTDAEAVLEYFSETHLIPL